MLGSTDIEGQVSQIAVTQKMLDEKIKEAVIENNKNSKLYRTLGISSGLALAIILI